MESSRKRRRPEGEEGSSLSRHQHRVFEATTRMEAATEAVRCLPPARHRHLKHRHLQNGVWNRRPTDSTVEQQGESKRRREHPEVPQAADSSCSSSSESSTDTERGLVDVCTIHCDNSEEEGRRQGGPISLDLTKWRFQQSRLPDQMQTIDRKLEAAVADWITDRFWWRRQGAISGGSTRGIHLWIVRNTSARGTVFSSHAFALRRELGAANRGACHKQVPRHVPDGD